VHVSSEGRTPREINFAGPNADFLLVANQDSDTILTFAVDAKTGALVKRQTIACPTPVCLLELPL